MLAFIGFDSPATSVVDRLLREGRLPVLAQARRDGVPLELELSSAYAAAGSYQTLYTGTEAGEHGHSFPLVWSPADQRLRYMDRFQGPEAVWERLSRAGRRCLVVDPYAGLPPRRLAGVGLSAWSFRNRVALRRWSRPDGAARELERRLGRGPRADEVYGLPRPGGLRALRRRLLAAPARSAAAVEHFLGREGFDFLWVMLSAGHLAGHHFWDLSLLADGDARAALRQELAETLADVYVETDAALGRILAALPPGSDAVVVSPLGMGPNTSRSDLLSGMIQAVLAGRGAARRDGAAPRIEAVRRLLPPGLREAVADRLPDPVAVDLTARLWLGGLDWSRTPAFALPGDHLGYVRLNVRGREREGIVAPDGAAELEDRLEEGLRSFVDPDGAAAVARVIRRREYAEGPRADLLPDLVIAWSDRPAAGLEGVTSPAFGDVERIGAGTGRPGNHRDEAWAILLPGGSEPQAPTGPARLVDLAATACRLLGADERGLAGSALLER